MPEAEPRERPYYQETIALGRASLGERHVPLYLQLHHSREPFSQHGLVSMTRTTDPLTYFHAKPFLIEPDLRLDVALYPWQSPGGAVGEVADVVTHGVRRREIGQAQAWHYPRDRLLLVWECCLLDRYQSGDPGEDLAHQALWRGFERTLLARCPAAERVATTWEDLYPRPAWRAFLERQGYRQVDAAVFAKPVQR